MVSSDVDNDGGCGDGEENGQAKLLDRVFKISDAIFLAPTF
jgi:hypothetical protein